jgi:hypothetical protein
MPLSGLAVRTLEQQRVRQAKERLAAGELWEDQDDRALGKGSG